MLDLDGTLAPIVARPEDAAISAETRELLAVIAERYGICAIVSGRRASVARAIVGLEAPAYAGNHGFETLAAGAPAGSRPEPAEALRAHLGAVEAFVGGLDRGALEEAGITMEDKAAIVALHWRRALDGEGAEALIEGVSAEAERAGLFTHRGRKVLELRPPIAIDKGVAVGALLDRSEARAALYAGDDRTDLDAFAELARRREEGELDAMVRVGVRSAEGPAEIVDQADLLVDGPGDMLPLLGKLAG